MGESGISAVENFIKSGKHFSAIVCANDEMAAGAMIAVRDAGLTIPDEVSVIGYDDINLASYLFPSLTTVHYPIEEMAAMATKWVLKNVYNQSFEVTNSFSPELV